MLGMLHALVLLATAFFAPASAADAPEACAPLKQMVGNVIMEGFMPTVFMVLGPDAVEFIFVDQNARWMTLKVTPSTGIACVDRGGTRFRFIELPPAGEGI